MLTPVGDTVRLLPAGPPVAVTLITTAVGAFGAPIDGTPPTPATVTAIVPWGPIGALNPPVPLRVSRIRDGVTAVYWLPPPVDVEDVNQPPTSTMTLTLPAPL